MVKVTCLTIINNDENIYSFIYYYVWTFKKVLQLAPEKISLNYDGTIHKYWVRQTGNIYEDKLLTWKHWNIYSDHNVMQQSLSNKLTWFNDTNLRVSFLKNKGN